MKATLPAPITLPDAFGAAVERWIDTGIRGGPLEPYLLELREVMPRLYAELLAELFRVPADEESS